MRHPGVQTFFGGLIGKPYGHVQAMATAWASNEGPTPKCLKPFLIPDMWFESDKVNQDKNNNNYMEPDATANGNGQGRNGGEQWYYQPPATGRDDYYAPFDPTVVSPPQPQTGYGSNFRGYPGDVGLPILFKPQTGNNQRQGNSYFTLDGDRAEPPRGHQDRLHRCRGRRHAELVAGQRDRAGQAGHTIPDQPGPGRHLEPGHESRSRIRPFPTGPRVPE